MEKLTKIFTLLSSQLQDQFGSCTVAYDQILEKDENDIFPIFEIRLGSASRSSFSISSYNRFTIKLISYFYSNERKLSIDSIEERSKKYSEISNVIRDWHDEIILLGIGVGELSEIETESLDICSDGEYSGFSKPVLRIAISFQIQIFDN